MVPVCVCVESRRADQQTAVSVGCSPFTSTAEGRSEWSRKGGGKELDAGAGQHTEPLLASSVPNLQLDALALEFNRADLEVDAAREWVRIGGGGGLGVGMQPSFMKN